MKLLDKFLLKWHGHCVDMEQYAPPISDTLAKANVGMDTSMAAIDLAGETIKKYQTFADEVLGILAGTNDVNLIRNVIYRNYRENILVWFNGEFDERFTVILTAAKANVSPKEQSETERNE